MADTIQRAHTAIPSLNAIVYRQYEALEKAKHFKLTDQPFAGVPIFKGLGQEQKGSVCTYGSRLVRM